MDMEFEKLVSIIVDVLGVDAEEITPDTTFVDDLGADSLDVAQIIMGIEEEFDVTVDQDQLSPACLRTGRASYRLRHQDTF